MIGLKNIQDVVSTSEFEILKSLEDALHQEEVELHDLQRYLLDTLSVVNQVLEVEEPIADVLPESAPVCALEEAADTTLPTPAIEDRIRERAAAIYVERGCEEGRAEEHWRQAESEVLGIIAPAPPVEAAPEETLEDRIRRRATEIYQASGCQEGRAEEHWRQAEAEITAAMLEERIRQRAAEIYRERGCEEGHADEHWLQAEIEIIGRPRVERRLTIVRSGAERRMASLDSPHGQERRSGQDRRRADRRVTVAVAMAAAAGAGATGAALGQA